MRGINFLRKWFGRDPAPKREEPIILAKHQAIYFPIPKVACTSWKMLCLELLGMKLSAGTVIHQAPFPRTLKADVHRYPGFFKFAFVRNPWARLVSCFNNKVKGDPTLTNDRVKDGVARPFLRFEGIHPGMSFEEFVEVVAAIPDAKANAHFRSQCSFLSDQFGRLLPDYIGKLEEAATVFPYVLKKLRVPDLKIPHKNKKPHEAYVTYYQPRIIELVRQRYAQDVAAFGYEFGKSSSLEASA